MMTLRIEKLQAKYLNEILQWRNSERVRSTCFNTKELTKDEHKAWFKNKAKKFLVFIDGTPAAVIVSAFVGRKTIYWSFYTKSSSCPQGLGKAMLQLFFILARTKLKVNYIYAEVKKGNTKSEALHRSLGFQERSAGFFVKSLLRLRLHGEGDS